MQSAGLWDSVALVANVNVHSPYDPLIDLSVSVPDQLKCTLTQALYTDMYSGPIVVPPAGEQPP